MRVSGCCNGERGSYTVEGALALTVFTACLMALISILSVIKTEAEIGDALHETAMELSQYSYVMGRTEYLKDAAGEKLPKLKEYLGNDKGYSDLALTGPAVAKLLTKDNFARDNVDSWLKKQGVAKGYEGLDFLDTQVLLDGKTIIVAATYDLNIQTFGLFSKTLHQRSAAVTYGLLPTDAALKAGKTRSFDEDSIWLQSNFVRGQYFANKIRSEGGYGVPVKPGQGIDLYDASSGTYVEAVSLNVFLPTYASSNAASFAPRPDALEKALFGYTKGLRKDITKLGQEVVLADGSTVKAVEAKRRVLILILPEETPDHKAVFSAVQSAAEAAGKQYGVSMEFRYEQKALVKSEEETTK